MSNPRNTTLEFRGDLLLKYRRKNNLTLREMAKRLQVKWSTLHRWENGPNVPYPHNRKVIAKILRIKPEKLFRLANNSNKEKT